MNKYASKTKTAEILGVTPKTLRVWDRNEALTIDSIAVGGEEK